MNPYFIGMYPLCDLLKGSILSLREEYETLDIADQRKTVEGFLDMCSSSAKQLGALGFYRYAQNVDCLMSVPIIFEHWLDIGNEPFIDCARQTKFVTSLFSGILKNLSHSLSTVMFRVAKVTMTVLAMKIKTNAST